MAISINSIVPNGYTAEPISGAVTPTQFEVEENIPYVNPFEKKDSLELSIDAVKSSSKSKEESTDDPNPQKTANNEKIKEDNGLKKTDKEEKDPNKKELSEEDKEVVDKLKKRDQEVKTHEQAHMAAGGQYVRGGASYTYQSGPDGKRYAIGGEVNIDTSPIPGKPDATITKMMTVRAAALAPAEPSGKDQAVAASATQAMAKAQAEKAKMRTEEAKGDKQDSSSSVQPNKKDTTQEPENNKPKPINKKSATSRKIASYTNNSSISSMMFVG